MKDLLSVRPLSLENVEKILQTATSFLDVSKRDIKKVPTLRGKTIVLAFFENSTRTKLSFELAAKRLSADIISFSSSTSSTKKGESLLDTARNIDAMSPDLMVLRHSQSRAPHLLAKHFDWGVINAGDGINEHPTQALLDLLTLKQNLGDIRGRKIGIIGDVYHSRVARSNIILLQKMGAKVIIAGPGTLCPDLLLHLGVDIRHGIDDVIDDIDALMMLRVQRERLEPAVMPSVDEYSRLYGLSLQRANKLRKDAVILHPGPINRGVEMDSDVVASERSVIMDQVKNGIAIRMALLYLLLGSQS